MDEHSEDQVDLQNPDEARPPKRVRLEQLDAPLSVTEQVQQEAMDDEDWDDVYGTPNSGAAPAPATLQSEIPAPDAGQANVDTNTLPPAPHEHEFGVAVQKPEDTKQNDAIDGVPAEAIADGDDLVAPPPHPAPENNDKASIDVMEETTQTEYQPPEATGPTQQGQSEPKGQAAHVAESSGGLLDQLMADVKPTQSQTKATDDPEFMQAAAAQKSNENAEWQFDSSDAESSSDSDTTDSDDSSDDSDAGSDADYEMLDAATAAKILMTEDGNEGENPKPGVDRQPRTQNEVKEEVVQKPDIKVTPDMKITFLGEIENVVENMVLIKGATPGEYQVLEGESVLCNEKREVLGRVRDTFGRVQEPMYSMAFTNAAEIQETGLQHGSKVFYVDDHSTFVFTQPLRNMKGTDASNIHDEEIAEDEQEFSDDEKEAEYKRQKKLAKKSGREGLSRSAFESGERIPPATGSSIGMNSDIPSQSYGGLSYDDDDVDNDFYQPLKRPDNLSQLMASGAPPPRQQQQPFGDRGRGRGRGDRGRGRGDRGRGDRGRGRGSFEQRGQRGGRGGSGSNQQQQQQQQQQQGAGHKGNARSFPDRHNSSDMHPSSSIPSNPQQQMPTQGYHQQQMPQAYQNSGYQFQQGNQPAVNASQYGYYGQQHNPQTPVGVPPGAHVNPAFFQQQGFQQQQQGQYQQYPQFYQQQQAHAQGQAAPGPQQAGPIDIGAILAQLQGQPPQR